MQRVLLSFIGLVIAAGIVMGALKFLRYYEGEQFSESNTKPMFVELDPIYLPTIKDDEVVATDTWNLVIETRDGGPYRLVLEQRGKLHDIYMNYLSTLSARRGPENIQNIRYVKQQLTLASTEFLGPNVVRDVLIKNLTRNDTPAG